MRQRRTGWLAARKIEAVYEAPYLAHAPMEPLNCTADVRADSCEVWASTQGQSDRLAKNEAVRVTGLKADEVKVYTKYMGGGFDAARAPIISGKRWRFPKRRAFR